MLALNDFIILKNHTVSLLWDHHTTNAHLIPTPTDEKYDYEEVRTEVSQLTENWKGFAMVLGLTQQTICTINTQKLDPAGCLDLVLKKWLIQDYDLNKYPLPSWRQLVRAVDHNTGGQNPALAKNIASK